MTDDEKDPIPMSSLMDDKFSYTMQQCDGDSKQSNSGHLSSLRTSSWSLIIHHIFARTSASTHMSTAPETLAEIIAGVLIRRARMSDEAVPSCAVCVLQMQEP